ncbi:uncharacterized protein LOC110974268 [Acanthaster planci]|uniref:Uncharacterized protein LOC110974268 n=1 Tax=Acanthaster planci TaxID=133434 RepID=A0A8B7XL05_ACAPL|nr:uncharacterized protein LOC110974268 [Acanthaster planci]
MPQDVSWRIPLPTLDLGAGEKINLRLRSVRHHRNGQTRKVPIVDRPLKPQLKMEEAIQSFLPSLKPKPVAKELIITSRTPSPCSKARPVPHLPRACIPVWGTDDTSRSATYNCHLCWGLAKCNPEMHPQNLPSISDTVSWAFRAKKERLKSARRHGGVAKDKKARRKDITKGQGPATLKVDAWLQTDACPVDGENLKLSELGSDIVLFPGTTPSNNVTLALPAIKGADTILPQHVVPLTFSKEKLQDMPRTACHREPCSDKRCRASSPADHTTWATKRFTNRM